jgi:ribonuclease BN (tRNA processing enzyme)
MSRYLVERDFPKGLSIPADDIGASLCRTVIDKCGDSLHRVDPGVRCLPTFGAVMSRSPPVLLLATLLVAGLALSAGANAQDEPAFELLVLGSGGPGATGRASSSYLILIEGKPRILVDAGPGSFARLGEARLSLESLDTVLLTHLHVDHAAELPGIVKARAVSAGGPIRFDIYGPAGTTARDAAPAFPSTSRFVKILFGSDGAFAYLKDFAAPISFHVTDLPRPRNSGEPAVVLSQGDLKVSAIAGHHGDAPSIIYRIDYHGKSIAFSGDVDPSGLPALAKLSAGVDLLVFDQVVLDRPDSPEVLYSLHSPPSDIGSVAARSRVKALLLSHLSPAVDQDRAAVTTSIARQYAGPVAFAADGLRISP